MESRSALLAPEQQGPELEDVRFSLASDIVELVVLTDDESFLQVLRDAVGSARRLWHVPTADKVSDLLVAGEVGILVLDEAALHQSAATFIDQIKRQFPDLVLVVAGRREAEVALAALISTGLVYRFIHKPMSPGRAKLFADAAVKKYGEQQRRSASPNLPARAARGRARLVGAISLLAVLGCATAWYLLYHRVPTDTLGDDLATAATAAALDHDTQQLARAAAALAANRLTTPSGDNALDLYLQALHRHPHDLKARAGLSEVHERLAARAENALLEERLTEAATAIDTARQAGVDTDRLAFLSTQLARSRERQRAAQLGNEPAVDSVKSEKPISDKVAQLLGLAMQRQLALAFTAPERDNARYYILEAARLEPNEQAVVNAKDSLALALLSAARSAIDRRDFAAADNLLQDSDGIAARSNLDNVRHQLADARLQAAAAAHERLAKDADDRLQQDHLIEPANDNAKYYVLTLQTLDPGNPALVGLIQDLGVRLVAKARRALALEQYDAARSWLDEVTSVGYSSGESAAAAHELNEALAHQRFWNNVVPAGELSLLKSIQPAYPPQAQRSLTEGWVELEFTVSEAGTVGDISIHGANPEGVFDAAATSALSQWIYRPILRDGKAVPQRARVRIRFTLAG